jgi:hypothetical protein
MVYLHQQRRKRGLVDVVSISIAVVACISLQKSFVTTPINTHPTFMIAKLSDQMVPIIAETKGSSRRHHQRLPATVVVPQYSPGPAGPPGPPGPPGPAGLPGAAAVPPQIIVEGPKNPTAAFVAGIQLIAALFTGLSALAAALTFIRTSKDRREIAVLDRFRESKPLFDRVASKINAHELSLDDDDVVSLLNTLEEIGIYAMSKGVDKEILQITFGRYIPWLWSSLEQHINSERIALNNPRLWINAERLAREFF